MLMRQTRLRSGTGEEPFSPLSRMRITHAWLRQVFHWITVPHCPLF